MFGLKLNHVSERGHWTRGRHLKLNYWISSLTFVCCQYWAISNKFMWNTNQNTTKNATKNTTKTNKRQMHLTISITKLRGLCSGLKMLSSTSLQSQLKLKIETFIRFAVYTNAEWPGDKKQGPHICVIACVSCTDLKSFTWATKKRAILTRYVDLSLPYIWWHGHIFCVTGLCEGNPPVTGGFLSQRTNNAEFLWFLWSTFR